MLPALMLAALIGSPALAAMPAEACREESARRGRLSPLEAQQLCAGAVDSRAPVRCFERAVDERGLSKQSAIALCARAASAAAVLDCQEAASLHGSFSRAETVVLCARAPMAGTPLTCAREAINRWLRPSDAASLCARSVSAEPLACYLRQTETGASRARALELCAAPD